MQRWAASVVADVNALATAWGSVRGGWRSAWRDASQFLSHRRALIDTEAPTQEGVRVVLRTRMRLTGDVQTDILRSWLNGTSPAFVDELVRSHFSSVAAAVQGWSVVPAGIRLGSLCTVALGIIPGSAYSIRLALRAEWQMLISALLLNWWVLSGIAIAVFGFLLRRILRLWLQWKFRGGLSIR
jgi:hypothetical protein